MLWMMTTMAFAAFTVEGSASSSRAEVNAVAKAVKDVGLKSRVVRRYRDGAGWEFILRLDAFDDRASANEAAKTLARRATGPVVILDDNGRLLDTLQGEAPLKAPPKPEPMPDPIADPKPTSEEAPVAPTPIAPVEPGKRLASSMKAHGRAKSELADADRVLLVYTRELSDGRVAKHTYARRGTDLYLEIKAKKGKIEPSTTLALGETAWLVDGEVTSTEDLQRARQTIEKFGPVGTIPVVLSLKRAVQEVPAFGVLKDRGTAKVGDTLCDVSGASLADDEMLVAFGSSDHLIRRISMGGGATVLEYGDYKSMGRAKIPHRVTTTEDGAVLSTVVIEKIEVDGELPDDWFEAPK